MSTFEGKIVIKIMIFQKHRQAFFIKKIESIEKKDNNELVTLPYLSHPMGVGLFGLHSQWRKTYLTAKKVATKNC